MVPLGDHIVEKVFREASAFAGVDIAINLSPVQLRQQGLPNRLGQLARRFGVDPRCVIFEVTESMLIESNDVTSDVFTRLREAGFRTALDDFGTGYSSLAYLGRFEFDKIKIDRSFVSNGSLDRLRPILEGIVHIGRGLRMDVVAEGVETAIELAMVQALGCNEAQGFHISPPMPLEAVAAFLAQPPHLVDGRETLHLASG
jgi:EAL domain-containing protein (putative c-di-GMP-specific phosphodiesterase class I)